MPYLPLHFLGHQWGLSLSTSQFCPSGLYIHSLAFLPTTDLVGLPSAPVGLCRCISLVDSSLPSGAGTLWRCSPATNTEHTSSGTRNRLPIAAQSSDQANVGCWTLLLCAEVRAALSTWPWAGDDPCRVDACWCSALLHKPPSEGAELCLVSAVPLADCS